jgi:small redox-active disulfide protein 2
MDSDNRPCCAADALRRIRQVPINGIPTGICMLDECIAEVKKQHLSGEMEIRAALLIRVSVYNYIPPGVEEEYARALLEEFRKPNGKRLPACPESLCDIMIKIEILGTGCAKCKRLFANAEQAVKDLKIMAVVVKVEDLAEIVGRGVMLPPALFINGEVLAEGRIPDINEIKKMLTE